MSIDILCMKKIIAIKIILLILVSFLFASNINSQTKIGDLYYTFSGENATVVSENRSAYGGANYTKDRYDIPSTVTYNGLIFNVTAIDNQAFGGFPNEYRGERYASIASVITLPTSIKSIGYAAFYACKNIVSMTIPPNVTYIGKYVFTSCDLLRELIYTGATAPEGWWTTSKTYVPDLKAYSNPTYRGNDAHIIEMISFAQKEFEYTGQSPTTTWTNNVEGYSVSLSMPTLKIDSGNYEEVIPATFKKGNESFTAYIVYRYTIKPSTKYYTLSVKAMGSGSVSYNGTLAMNNTQSFTLKEGTSATITFSPDNGYRIKSVKVNSKDVTSSISNNQYTISNISTNTTIEVEFEAIPSSEPNLNSGECGENVYYSYDSATKTLNIYGEGVINYANPWSSFEDDIRYIIIEPGVSYINDENFNGCSSLTSVKIASSVAHIGSESFNGCTSLTSVHITDLAAWCKIEFYDNPLVYAHHLFLNDNEITDLVIPNSVTSISYHAFHGCSSLVSVTIPNSVTFIGGYAFDGCNGLATVISEIENPFVIENSVFDGIPSDAQLIVPKGAKAKYQATAGWNQFTNIVEAREEPDLQGQIHKDDIYYKVTGSGEAEVVSVEEGEKSVSVPSTISHNNTTYKVTSIAKEVFDNREYLAAVIWEPKAQFNAKVSNPNFLLYVKDEKYASHTVKNVVVNGVAENIELADAANGNDFYCPRAFTAKNISYSHNYQMETGLGESKGWETIVLPFDVQKYMHATKGELESFTTWSRSSNKKPFWLFELTADGYKDVAGIKANTPYIISMPNNRQYEQQYQIPGIVTFSATNVEVKKSDDVKSVSYQGRTLVPNYTNQNNLDYLLLNVNNNFVTYSGADPGSKFIGGLRNVHPFEAYMTTTDGTRSIDVLDGMTTAIKEIRMISDDTEVIKVYDTKGVLVKTVKANDDLRSGLATGIYIVNRKKIIIK